MNEKLQLIQLIIQSQNTKILKQVQDLLLQEMVEDFALPESLWKEVDQIRKDRLKGKGGWISWEKVKNTLEQKNLQWVTA